MIKPTVWKILLTIILMAGINYWWISNIYVLDAVVRVGVPIGFYPKGSCYLKDINTKCPVVNFSHAALIIDIICWYLISCLISFIFIKIKASFKNSKIFK